MGAWELESGDVVLAAIRIRKMTIGTTPAAAIDIGSKDAFGCREPDLH
jgi:hypothetical protein